MITLQVQLTSLSCLYSPSAGYSDDVCSSGASDELISVVRITVAYICLKQLNAT